MVMLPNTLRTLHVSSACQPLPGARCLMKPARGPATLYVILQSCPPHVAPGGHGLLLRYLMEFSASVVIGLLPIEALRPLTTLTHSPQ